MTTIIITITVDDDDFTGFADPDHDTGLTTEGYERLSEALMSSVASGIVDIVQE